MEQNLKLLAEKELNEQLKRGKPKDVKKLYDLFCKSDGKEKAFGILAGALIDNYELMPNGRYRLNTKQYNRTIEEHLKLAKAEKHTVPPVKNDSIKKLDSRGIKQKLGAAIVRYETMEEFAETFEKMMFIDEKMASRLYVENKELFFKTLDHDISELQESPVAIERMDMRKDRNYFYLNLIQDISFCLYNSISDNFLLMNEYEQFIRKIVSRPLDWANADRHEYELLLSSLLEKYIKAGEMGKAIDLIQQWKCKLPDTNMPEKAIITAHWFSGRPDGHKRALELANQLLDENRQLKGDEVLVLGLMEKMYEDAGDAKRLEQVKALRKKYNVA